VLPLERYNEEIYTTIVDNMTMVVTAVHRAESEIHGAPPEKIEL
jgi:hypothetical protein